MNESKLSYGYSPVFQAPAKLLCQVTSKLDAWTIERCVATGFASKMGWSTAARPRRRHAPAQVMATVRPAAL